MSRCFFSSSWRFTELLICAVAFSTGTICLWLICSLCFLSIWSKIWFIKPSGWLFFSQYQHQHTVKCTVQISTHNSAQSWVFVYELSGCGFESSCSHEFYMFQFFSSNVGAECIRWALSTKVFKVPLFQDVGENESQCKQMFQWVFFIYCYCKLVIST